MKPEPQADMGAQTNSDHILKTKLFLFSSFDAPRFILFLLLILSGTRTTIQIVGLKLDLLL